MNKQVFLFFSLFILLSCQFGNKKSLKTGELSIIDLSKNYPKKEIHIQSIAEIEYIPFETTDDVLIGDQCFLDYISDNYILVRDLNDVFVFNRNGKIVTHFNHRGQGSGEYNRIEEVVFDEKNEEIFVVDNYSTYRILVYSLTGQYKRTLKYSHDLIWPIVYNFDDESLLLYDFYGKPRQDTYSEKPYLFLSKQDGSIISVLDFKLPVRYSTTIRVDELRYSVYRSPIIVCVGQDFVIADISSDTIYNLSKNKELNPLLIRKPSVHSSDPLTFLSPILTTDNYMVLLKKTKDERKYAIVYGDTLLFDFTTKATNRITFVNDDYPANRWFPLGFIHFQQKDVAACLIDVYKLKEAYAEKQLKGELEKLVTTLDEDDNPVLMIVKFK